MKRNPRDHQIVESLTTKVRMLSLEQIAEGWWDKTRNPKLLARRRLTVLAEEGLLEETVVLALPRLPLTEPLWEWHKGQSEPDFGAIAWTLQSRWPRTAPSRTTILMATKAAHNRYGGALSGGRIRVGQIDHDLHVGAVYLIYLRTRPDMARVWVGEDVLPKSGYGLKDPDAILELDGGKRTHVVEFGGRYDKQRIQGFHEDCVRRGRSYEIW
ncbi:MAG: hypothetical protein HY287_02460 [Planctomycetes bacterium]|nr:hypothetical protein [Planctomycetota bacterium]MBI3833172.1 hypothetical protein [Planctomycetota bacterium]